MKHRKVLITIVITEVVSWNCNSNHFNVDALISVFVYPFSHSYICLISIKMDSFGGEKNLLLIKTILLVECTSLQPRIL